MDDNHSITNQGDGAIRLVDRGERKNCIETILNGTGRSSGTVLLKSRFRGLLEQLAGTKLDSTMIDVTVLQLGGGRFQVGFAEGNASRTGGAKHFGLTAVISSEGEVEDCAFHCGKAKEDSVVGGTRRLPREDAGSWGVAIELIDSAIHGAREVGPRAR